MAACSQSPQEKLQHINGYWEIASIENADGQKKEFGYSQNIDFIQIKEDNTGVRKKVQPNITGEFKTSDSSENIHIITHGDTLIMEYITAFDNWQETVEKATASSLVLKNQHGNIYTYRRYEPIKLEE